MGNTLMCTWKSQLVYAAFCCESSPLCQEEEWAAMNLSGTPSTNKQSKQNFFFSLQKYPINHLAEK